MNSESLLNMLECLENIKINSNGKKRTKDAVQNWAKKLVET